MSTMRMKTLLALLLIGSISSTAIAAPRTRHKSTPKAKTPAVAVSASHARVVIRGSARDGEDETWRRQKDSELSLDERTAKKIEEMLRTGPLRYGTTALYVVDAVTGQELFAVHPDDPLNPASNVKLISTATALDVLGADFRYRTRLLGPTPEQDGTVDGDLYLLGSYDPTLDADGVHDLAAALAARGVHAIKGGIVVGKDDDREGMIRGKIQISVDATTPGKPPTISITPLTPFAIVTNDVTTSKRKKSAMKVTDGASTDAKGHARWSVHLTGTIGRGRSATYTIWPDPRGELTASLLVSDLAKAGITVGGEVRVDDLSDYATEAGTKGWLPVELAAHESEPLAAIVAQVNKRSINWLADRIVMTAGAAKFGAAPSMSRALDAMYDWLHAHASIDRASLYVDTGSGLSHKTTFSARQIVNVLRAASGLADAATAPAAGDAHAQACHAAYLASLSVGGVDGTLRGRFHGTLRGKLHAKTGTLNGAIALSGFLDVAPGHTLAFALVTNGNPSGSHKQVRAAHERLVTILADYATSLAASDPKPAAAPVIDTPVVTPSSTPAPDLGDDSSEDSDDPAAVIPGGPP